jgi:hypothetical protein
MRGARGSRNATRVVSVAAIVGFAVASPTAEAQEVEPVAGPVASSPPAKPPEPVVRIHIRAPTIVQLYRHVGVEWVHACESPCDVELPLADEYRTFGGRNGTSQPFRLHGSPGESIEVTVDPPATGGVGLGVALGAFSGLALLFSSGLALEEAGELHDTVCGQPRNCQNNQSTLDAGLVTMAVSAAVLTVGLAIAVSSAQVDILQRAAPPAPDVWRPRFVGLSASASGAAFLPRPTWRELSAAPTFNVPVFLSGSF